MERMSPTLQVRHGAVLNFKPSHRAVPSDLIFRVRCAARAPRPREEAAVSKKWTTEDVDNTGLSCRKRREMNCGRRRVLAGLVSPLLFKYSLPLGRQTASAADATEDPVEMAVVAVLDARDMIPALSTFLLQAKSKFGPSSECKTRLKALTLVYNRLKINLPRLVEELELNEDFSEQLLQGLALVEEDMCSQSMVSSPGSLIENQTISRVNVEGSLKSLKLARSKVDVLLQQVPSQLLELAQLARGVRPMA
ncbi:uncharacterized protein [Physcomitrium patens]|uniref:Uncharacterized protein n=1 Tax=Physcomitrium patens TaxID=3218 RepID=A0A7I4CRR6_PHYPA|nr:uncharacterized protein LOC112277949 [Physcomitrium patens]|eukprot:XP_024366607.1 uncharacterized protein LOC112277949 [Physcomitrella patens]